MATSVSPKLSPNLLRIAFGDWYPPATITSFETARPCDSTSEVHHVGPKVVTTMERGGESRVHFQLKPNVHGVHVGALTVPVIYFVCMLLKV